MTIEIIVLAMASTIRPTSLAAVYALLAHDSRRVLILAYVTAGLVFTIGFGLIVVYALHGIHLSSGTDKAKGVAELIGGVVALGFGIGLLTGRLQRRHAHEAPEARGRIKAMLDGHLTTRTALVAGPVTHIPGLFYILALNVIVAHNPRLPRGTLALLGYNAIWFALPIVSLVLCVLNPAAARDVVGSVERWARQHSRVILIWVSLLAGAVLVVRGALTV
jgi:hypothetical protein